MLRIHTHTHTHTHTHNGFLKGSLDTYYRSSKVSSKGRSKVHIVLERLLQLDQRLSEGVARHQLPQQ
jgi:hypothetical protein